MKLGFTTLIAITRLAVLGAVTLILGCSSTPQHTNVLIFGTNTKVALDVSQDITSGVGVTLGYKRQEAVWMPLLPNQAASSGGMQPSTCTTSTDCPKFVGSDSAKQTDTYSVLASFGSKLSGGVDAQGKDARVNGEIAQYFATGLAARLLAQSGGAGLVSTQQQPLSAAQTAAVNVLVKQTESEQSTVIAAVQDAADPTKIDATKLKALLDKAAAAKVISEGAKTRIGSSKTTAALQNLLVIYDLETAKLASLIQ